MSARRTKALCRCRWIRLRWLLRSRRRLVMLRNPEACDRIPSRQHALTAVLEHDFFRVLFRRTQLFSREQSKFVTRILRHLTAPVLFELLLFCALLHCILLWVALFCFCLAAVVMPEPTGKAD